jgi:hypothetical protein
VHERDRFALGEIPPPAGRNRPETKANFTHGQVGVSIRAELHYSNVNAFCLDAKNLRPHDGYAHGEIVASLAPKVADK